MNTTIEQGEGLACANARIVILDEEALSRIELEAFLRSLGYEQVSSLGPQDDMLVVLRDERPDLILLDLGLRRPTAYELLARLGADRTLRHVPVLAITASDERQNRLRALKLGARDYLIKPIDPADLELRLRNTLLAKIWHDRLAHIDGLTGLPNRESSLQRLDWALKFTRRERSNGALLQVGLHRFKQIIGTLGPAVGDELLRAVGARLVSCVRETDLVSSDVPAGTSAQVTRGDGDEFTILLPMLTRDDQASVVAERVVRSMTEPFHVFGQELFVRCMIGIATFGGEDSDRDTVLRQAKLAMRDVRAAGDAAGTLAGMGAASETTPAAADPGGPAEGPAASKVAGNLTGNGFRFYSQELNDRAAARMALERELHYALERQELVLHYQPKVDLANARICGAEALVRWQHPQRGLLGPNEFIETAEECGLIVPLGEWVLDEALRQSGAWRRSGLRPFMVSVNVSSHQLRRAHFEHTVRDALTRHGLDGASLCLELTESAIIETGGDVIATLQSIKAQGVRLALDDFGTGYSSLSYLRRFPIDELKIDRSFVVESEAGVGSAALIIRAIIAMAHGLSLSVVAEGVETRAQLDFLRANACDQYQGYLFSRPVPASAFEALSRASDAGAFGAAKEARADCVP